jgi:hypothetical protein
LEEVAVETEPVVTTTSYTPAVLAGAVAVHWVADAQLTPVAAVPPTLMVAVGVKLVPFMVIEGVDPAAVCVGLTEVTVGAAKVYWSAAVVALVPPVVVTVTSTRPAPCADEITVNDVVLAAVTVPEFVPNLTVLLPAVALKLVPPMVTTVPPPVEPPVGLTEVTVGGLAAGAQVKLIAADCVPCPE